MRISLVSAVTMKDFSNKKKTNLFFLLRLCLMSFNRINSIYFFFFILTASISGLKVFNRLTTKKDCCIAPKTNINSEKANAGKELLQRLAAQSDMHEEVTPEKMCHFVHFLFQQASINKKSISLYEGDDAVGVCSMR